MTTPNDERMTEIWQDHRPYLIDLAFRMLGNIHDAEDIVQEAFSRLWRQDVDAIDDVRGWLVVVVSRICLDHLRSARVRRETQSNTIDEHATAVAAAPAMDPADRVTLDDNISLALLVVLRQLNPAERAVFVLHDVFQFSFDSIATIVGRTPAACRQLASRARRRIEEQTDAERFTVDPPEQHRITERFIAACASGDLEGLMTVLHPDVSGDADLGALRPEGIVQHGRVSVGRNLLAHFGPTSGTTLVTQPVNGATAILGFRAGRLYALVQIEFDGELIREMHAIADPAKLALIDPLMT
jgi:RNA polymerase sigma-70 factor (ECF subfamily)